MANASIVCRRDPSLNLVPEKKITFANNVFLIVNKIVMLLVSGIKHCSELISVSNTQ